MNAGAVDIGRFRRDYLSALLTGQPRHALAVLDGALAAGLPLTAVYVDIVQAVMYTIGEGWERAELTIAEEHLATAVVQSNLAMLAGRRPALPEPTGRPPPGRVVVTVAPGEQHALGARILADCLDGAGWQVEYVPPPVSDDVLVGHLSVRRPDVVALSAALPTHLSALAAAVERIRSLADPPLVALGGALFIRRPQLAVRFGADVTAPDAEAAVEAIGAMSRSSP